MYDAYTLRNQKNWFGSANIRQHVSGKGVRSVTFATMTSYHDSSDFEHGVTVGVRKVDHNHLPGSDANRIFAHNHFTSVQ